MLFHQLFSRLMAWMPISIVVVISMVDEVHPLDLRRADDYDEEKLASIRQLVLMAQTKLTEIQQQQSTALEVSERQWTCVRLGAASVSPVVVPASGIEQNRRW